MTEQSRTINLNYICGTVAAFLAGMHFVVALIGFAGAIEMSSVSIYLYAIFGIIDLALAISFYEGEN